MAIATERITEEQLMRLPQDGRKYELVNGEIKEASTGDKHDAIVALIIFLIYPFTRGRGMVCASHAGFWMSDGNLRAPDASFTRTERLPGGEAPDKFGYFAPDLCIEVISPSEEEQEVLEKVAEYFASGAEQVWQVYPETQRVAVFITPETRHVYEANDELSGGDLLPGFHCRVADLFAIG